MLIKEIDKILENKLTGRHTFFQLEFFIIQSEPTHQAKLHQCIVELKSRRNNLNAIELEIAEVSDQKELLLLERPKLSKFSKEGEIKLRMFERKLDALDNRLLELQDIKRSNEEESQFLLNLYKKLIIIEPLKDWDNPEVQLEYWNAKLTRELKIKAVLGQPVDTELGKTIMSLPDISPIKQEMIGNIKKNIDKQTINS